MSSDLRESLSRHGAASLALGISALVRTGLYRRAINGWVLRWSLARAAEARGAGVSRLPFTVLRLALAYGNDATRVRAAEALGALGDPRAAEWLALAASATRREDVFEAAAVALANLGDLRAIPLLLQGRYGGGARRESLSKATEGLRRLGTAGVEMLVQRLTDRSVHVIEAQNAASALKQIGWKPTPDAAGVAYLLCSDVPRDAFIRQCKEIGSTALDPLTTWLSRADCPRLESVAEVLRQIGDPRAVPPLMQKYIDLCEEERCSRRWERQQDDSWDWRVADLSDAKVPIFRAVSDLATPSQRSSRLARQFRAAIEGFPSYPHKNPEPLLDAVRAGDLEMCRRLLCVGFDADETSGDTGYGQSALGYAAAAGQRTLCELLLDHGADPFLCWEVEPGTRDPGIEELVEAAMVHAEFPLVRAAARGHIRMCERLLAGGADVNERDPAGNTPLIAAIKRLEGGPIVKLLAAGADIHARDREGMTALLVEAEQGRRDVLRLVLAQDGGLRRAVEGLLKLLEDLSWPVRRATKTALGNVDGAMVRPGEGAALLAPLLRDVAAPSPDVRAAIARLLGLVLPDVARGEGAHSVVEALIELLEDTDYSVRWEAGRALSNVDETVMRGGECAALLPLLLRDLAGGRRDARASPDPLVRDPGARVRENAARLLGLMCNAGAIPPLTRALGDADAEVRKAAQRALDHLRGEPAPRSA